MIINYSTNVRLSQVELEDLFILLLSQVYCCRFISGCGGARWVNALKFLAGFPDRYSLLDLLLVTLLVNYPRIRRRVFGGSLKVKFAGTLSDGSRTDVLIQFSAYHVSTVRDFLGEFSRKMRSGEAPVPADRSYPFTNNSIYLKYRYTEMGRLSAGTPPATGLKSPSIFLKHYDRIYYLLLPIVGSPQRAESTKTGLRLQALTGRCFASARYLAASGLASEKSWDRNVSRLRKLGLVRTSRLYRPNGEQATNLVDLSALWALLLRLLQSIHCHWEKVSTSIWFKLSGAWVPINQLLSNLRGPPS